MSRIVPFPLRHGQVILIYTLAELRWGKADMMNGALTNPFNAQPAWLAHLHATLDRAVWAAYGRNDADPGAVPEDKILARLLALNLARSGA